MTEIKVAIIGGTGVYKQSLLEDEREITVDTRYGTVTMKHGSYKDREIFFLARHGSRHSVPPHLVNYRANIASLKKIGANAIIATAAVGTLRENMPPGSRVIIDQFIDCTKQRPLTFYDGNELPVVHIDLTEPYCFELRKTILNAGHKLGLNLVDGGCYVCTEGPRFETPAEIRMMEKLGGDLVGMTNVPEVILAREAGLCYATIALPTNYAAGISCDPLTHEEVIEEMERGKPGLDKLLAACVKAINPDEYACDCRKSGKSWAKES